MATVAAHGLASTGASCCILTHKSSCCPIDSCTPTTFANTRSKPALLPPSRHAARYDGVQSRSLTLYMPFDLVRLRKRCAAQRNIRNHVSRGGRYGKVGADIQISSCASEVVSDRVSESPGWCGALGTGTPALRGATPSQRRSGTAI